MQEAKLSYHSGVYSPLYPLMSGVI